MAQMPTPRMNLAAAADTTTGRIYVLGGRTSIGGAPIAAHELYDSNKNAWYAKAPMPTARYDFGLAFLNGKLYAIGGTTNGLTALDTVEEYDCATDTWRTLPPLSHPRFKLCVAVYDGKVLAMGGTDGGADFGGTDVFDPATGQWSAGPAVGYSMIGFPTGFNAFVDDNTKATTIVLLGGVNRSVLGPIDPGPPLAFRLSPSAYFSIGSGGYSVYPANAGGAVFYHEPYFCGGEDPIARSVLADTQRADGTFGWGMPSSTGLTKVAPLSRARRWLAAASTAATGSITRPAGFIYVFGGEDGNGVALDLAERFTPP